MTTIGVIKGDTRSLDSGSNDSSSFCDPAINIMGLVFPVVQARSAS